MIRENKNNIIITCADCAAEMYPNKGKFDIKVGDSVKLHFEEKNMGEFMWVKVTNLVKSEDGDTFEGILDNDPIFITDIICGDKVTFTKEDVYDRFNDSK